MMFDDDTPPWEPADNEPINPTHGWAMAIIGIALLALCGYWLSACGAATEPTATDPPTTVTVALPPMPTTAPLLAIEAAPAATATSQAVRVAPPTTDPCSARGLNCLAYAPPDLDSCARMVWYMEQWSLPARLGDYGRHGKWTRTDGLGWRESKCNNDAVSGTHCCGGWWQLYIGNFIAHGHADELMGLCQVDSLEDVTGLDPLDEQRQACATAWLVGVSGLSPWAPL